MEKEAIQETILSLVDDLGVSFPKEDTPIRDIQLVKDLGLDSIDLVELIMGIEDEYDILIKDEEVKKIKNIGEAVDFIYKRIQ